jgi:hypothetical protein
MRIERRRYFRIDDTALLKYRVLAAGELDAARAQIAQHILAADNLRAALEPLDVRLAELTPALRRESRVVAEAVELINRKLAVVMQMLAREPADGINTEHREFQPCTVSLSGGGLAIRADAALPADTWLAIDLELLPSHYALRAIGRVTDVRTHGGAFLLGVEFDVLCEADRDALVTHALRKQAQILREARNGPTPPD